MKTFIYLHKSSKIKMKSWFKNWVHVCITNKDFRIKRYGYNKLIVWKD